MVIDLELRCLGVSLALSKRLFIFLCLRLETNVITASHDCIDIQHGLASGSSTWSGQQWAKFADNYTELIPGLSHVIRADFWEGDATKHFSVNKKGFQ